MNFGGSFSKECDKGILTEARRRSFPYGVLRRQCPYFKKNLTDAMAGPGSLCIPGSKQLRLAVSGLKNKMSELRALRPGENPFA